MLSFLFPEKCVVTKKQWTYLSSEGSRLLQPHPEICYLSHTPSKHYKVSFAQREKTSLEGIIIGFSYNTYIKDLIISIKLKGKYTVANILAQKLALHILSHPIADTDYALTYVPNHRYKRIRKRGYNQSAIIAKHLWDILQKPVYKLAKKNRHTRSQLSLSREQRHENVRNSFSLLPHQTYPHSHLLIIDDVLTTWATISELAKTIQKTYDCSIWWAVLARNMK